MSRSTTYNAISTSDSTWSMSWVEITGIAIGGILCIALCFLLYYFFTMYCFYISDKNSRPQFLFTHSAEERDCGTIACININKQLILCCCPSLTRKVNSIEIYQKADQSVNISNTATNFAPYCLNNTTCTSNHDHVHAPLLSSV